MKVTPVVFKKDRETAIRDEINRKYTNKVGSCQLLWSGFDLTPYCRSCLILDYALLSSTLRDPQRESSFMVMAASITRVGRMTLSVFLPVLKADFYVITVIFRLVVFKPFIDEVVLAKVSRSSREGIKSRSILSTCWLRSCLFSTF